MSLIDVLIRQRDALLDRILGVRTEEVLNPSPATQIPAGGSEIVKEIKQAMNAFKASAMDASGARVDYDQLRASETYTSYRTQCSPQLRTLDLNALTDRAERLAFWINLYNALVVDAVISLGVRSTVVEGRLGVLRFFRQAAYNVGGHRFSCDDIEHGILRANAGHPFIPGPQFARSDARWRFTFASLDPRIHFALNCASRSCPPIGVYDAEHIDAQLDLAARSFINASTCLDEERDTLHLSPIFRWYAGDFSGRSCRQTGKAGIVKLLLHNLPDDERRAWLTQRSTKAQITYTPYDWSLNAYCL